MTGPEFEIRQEILIHAPRELVYRYFIDPERLATWMGEGSRIGARAGDPVEVSVPGGARARGEVLEAVEPERIRFSWGYDDGREGLSPGASTVEVSFSEDPRGTRVRLRHVLPVEAAGAGEDLAWTCHVARLAARAAHGHLSEAAAAAHAAWVSAWNADGEALREALGKACLEDVVYQDDTIRTEGRERLAAHVARCRAISPEAKLEAAGPPLLLGDLLTADHRMTAPDGTEFGRLRLVATVSDTGRLARVNALFETPIPGVSPGAGLPQAAETRSAAPPAKPLEPHFWVTDPKQAVDFYADALGFEVLARFPADQEPTWYQLGRGPMRLMVAAAPKKESAKDHQAYLAEAADRTGTPGALSLYLSVEDVDAVHAACTEAGAKIVEPLWNPFWGGRQFTVADPDGHWWTVTGRRRED